MAKGVKTAIISLSVLLALTIFASFLAARIIGRRIVGAIEAIYAGTNEVETGNFAYRIPLTGRDQLAQLTGAFNRMTAAVEHLLGESKEKQRLETEMKLAHEVQARMFPRESPALPNLEVYGECRPAFTVSGDFYDYFDLPGSRVALLLGDVAGKGISSALVMASIAYAARGELASLARDAKGTEDLGSALVSLSRISTLTLTGAQDRKNMPPFSSACMTRGSASSSTSTRAISHQ